MVITSSGDSTNTLVSLDRYGLKRADSLRSFFPVQEDLASSTRTQIRLPEGQDLALFNDLDCCFDTEESSLGDYVVYLPAGEQTGIDECLRNVPALQASREHLLNRGLLEFKTQSPHKYLYIAQGEIAHCTSSQNDFLVSDKATTCHILALRSCSSNSKREALCTLTHIDGTRYADSLRAAIQEHANYQQHEKCAMDIHIVGGYEDKKGTSRDTSNWLLEELATLAEDFHDTIEFTLQTACITCMNTTSYHHNTPIVRGLALNCRTGQVSVAQCRGETGPAEVPRAARMWVPHSHPQQQQPTLHLVYSHTTERVIVQPFQIVKFRGLEAMLKLPDHALLQYCSTSPDCEEDDFVPTVRRTLQFLRDHAGSKLQQLQYRRSHNSNNQWVAVV